MDAILSLAVTQLVDRIVDVKQARHPAARDEALTVDRLDAAQVRDVMLLAACYDQSTAENLFQRWRRLRKKLRFPAWRSKWDLALGLLTTAAVIGFIVWQRDWSWLAPLAALRGDCRRLGAAAGDSYAGGGRPGRSAATPAYSTAIRSSFAGRC